MHSHIFLLKKSLIYNNILNKFLIIFIILFFSSCTNNRVIKLKEGARFIDTNQKRQNIVKKKLKLSTSYVENQNRICIYIKDDTKIIKEVSQNEDCMNEI